MKLCISNIAWKAHEDLAVRELLAKLGVTTLEIAPARIGSAGLDSNPEEVEAYKQFWAEAGIELVAMQALLFGTNAPMQLFGSAEEQANLLAQLKKVMAIGQQLGISSYVFGSPKNRVKGALAYDEAVAQSLRFWHAAGDAAVAYGGKLLIEPNPVEYGGDFVHHTLEAANYAHTINHTGISWHLDAGTDVVSPAGEKLADALAKYGDGLRVYHYHVSALMLAPVYEQNPEPYAAQVQLLKQMGYSGSLSIEMRSLDGDASNIAHVEKAIGFLKSISGL